MTNLETYQAARRKYHNKIESHRQLMLVINSICSIIAVSIIIGAIIFVA